MWNLRVDVNSTSSDSSNRTADPALDDLHAGRRFHHRVSQFGATGQEFAQALFHVIWIVVESTRPPAHETLTIRSRVYGSAQRAALEALCR